MFNVKLIEIQNKESRLTSEDVSLNKSIGDKDGNEFIALLQDESQNPEEILKSSIDSKLKKT